MKIEYFTKIWNTFLDYLKSSALMIDCQEISLTSLQCLKMLLDFKSPIENDFNQIWNYYWEVWLQIGEFVIKSITSLDSTSSTSSSLTTNSLILANGMDDDLEKVIFFELLLFLDNVRFSTNVIINISMILGFLKF